MEALERNILATLCYFNELNYPLSAFEIWQHLLVEDYSGKEKINFYSVLVALDGACVRQHVEEYRGFYFLSGRRKLVGSRIGRNKISVGKIKRLCRTISFFRCLPFVRMVAVTGRLAMKNAQRRSDWDVLVVIKSGRIWIGRTLATLGVWLMGKWRTDKKTTDKICLNYFITEQSLEIGTKDLFSANEYSLAFPLLGWETWRSFFEANQWITKFFPQRSKPEIPPRGLVSNSKFFSWAQLVGEKIFDWDGLEGWLRKIEKDKIRNNPKTHLEGSFIEATDRALIFLPVPQGPRVFERFKKSWQKII
jgi:hypothetical protein